MSIKQRINATFRLRGSLDRFAVWLLIDFASVILIIWIGDLRSTVAVIGLAAGGAGLALVLVIVALASQSRNRVSGIEEYQPILSALVDIMDSVAEQQKERLEAVDPVRLREAVEALHRMEGLDELTRISVLRALSEAGLKNINSKGQHSILELQGLGKHIWAGIDAQEYVDQERNSWSG